MLTTMTFSGSGAVSGPQGLQQDQAADSTLRAFVGARRRRLGHYGDGYGKRFLLGPLYMIMGDLDGALTSFAWFENEFSDSSDMAPQLLCWTLALHQAGEDDKARRMLRRTMFANLYIIPRLLGMEVRRHGHLARLQHE